MAQRLTDRQMIECLALLDDQLQELVSMWERGDRSVGADIIDVARGRAHLVRSIDGEYEDDEWLYEYAEKTFERDEERHELEMSYSQRLHKTKRRKK